MTFHEALFQAELPNLLIGSGIIFLVIAVLGEVTGKFKADRTGRVAAALVGPLLIVLGLVVFALAPSVAPTPVDTGSGAVIVEPTTITVVDDQPTPPDDVPDVDQLAVDTTPDQTTPVPMNVAGGTAFEREPNDVAATATLVDGGVTVTGEVRSTYDPDPSMDSDYFAVWADAGDPITVDVAREGGAGTLYVVLLDPNGLSEPSGDPLSDVVTVESGDRVRLEAVASRSGYHYVLVSGWLYLIDLDLYFNDGGTGAYTVVVGANDRSSTDGPAIESTDRTTWTSPPATSLESTDATSLESASTSSPVRSDRASG